MLDTKTLRLDTPAEGVLLITLDRPSRLNAQTPEMFAELGRVGDYLRGADHVRVAIVTGAGRAFCAGYDLDEAGALEHITARQMLDRQELAARSIEGLRSAPQPVIAAVNGPAAGGGFSLALACDMRIGSPSAKFNAAFVRIGLSAGDLGLSWTLPRIVNPGMAAELIYTGRFVEAPEAERLGIINRIVPADRLLDEALGLAAQIVRNSPFGTRVSKTAIQTNLDGLSFQTALELENRGQSLVTRSEDMYEALSAFREGRQPAFTGR